MHSMGGNDRLTHDAVVSLEFSPIYRNTGKEENIHLAFSFLQKHEKYFIKPSYFTKWKPCNVHSHPSQSLRVLTAFNDHHHSYHEAQHGGRR